MMSADELSASKYATSSRLRWERVRRGLTIREACAAVGISSSSLLFNWELSNTTPEPHYRFLVAKFYGVPAAELFDREWHARRVIDAMRERVSA